MNRLLPTEPTVDEPDTEPQVVDLEDSESGDVVSVLTSAVARSILAHLYESPSTQSELADHVDTSIQNVDYHIDNLLEADLVTVADQWYSENGAEMDVYAPTSEPLVLVAGGDDGLDGARQAVTDAGSRPATTKAGD